MEVNKYVKGTFSVIGKEGSTGTALNRPVHVPAACVSPFYGNLSEHLDIRHDVYGVRTRAIQWT
ncbi:MAG: hypothetical protein LBB43_02395 [Spirochaetaceae bacterium]|jgi:hypothetical protein|nr:hypothetical protein [Spirochaetaceae bacterium]